MAECGDILVLRPACNHRVDPQKQPELRAEDAVDSALCRHLGFPLGDRKCDASPGDDLAILVLCGGRNRDNLTVAEACVQQSDESIILNATKKAGMCSRKH
jgi:hypothetical protein